MTKERRLAIEMWEYISENIDTVNLAEYKRTFCQEHNLRWMSKCWFCQYMRRDYREFHPGRKDGDAERNGCELCPLYKDFAKRYEVTEDDMCGCSTVYDTLYNRAIGCNKEAARRILELLRGGKV